MDIGPVEYVVIEFQGNNFNGQIIPALADMVANDTIRILDVLFVRKDADGEVAVFEYDDLEDTQAFADIEGEAGGLFGEDDAALLAEALAPESSAVILLWEDLWAKPFADAVRASGGTIARGERVAPEEVAELLAAIDQAS